MVAVNAITSEQPRAPSACLHREIADGGARARVNITLEPRRNKCSLSDAILADGKVCDHKESQFPNRLALVAARLIQIPLNQSEA